MNADAVQCVNLSPDVAVFVMRAHEMSAALECESSVVTFVMRAGEMSNAAHAVLTAAFEWAKTHEKPMTMVDYRAMNELQGVTEAVE